VIAWVQLKGIIKWKMVVFTKDNARLHMVIAIEYKDVSIVDNN
jgi:hypothetical protein